MSKRRLLLRKILPSIARAYLGFALKTTRWHVIGPQASRGVLIQTPVSSQPGAVVAFWHRNLLLLPALWQWARNRNGLLRLNVLISRNRDGRLIRRIVAPWEIIGIEGSSNKGGQDKGGARALRAGVKALESGALLAITPDGPRGPAEKVQAGAEALGRLSRRVTVPIGGYCHAMRLGTWDRMRIPLPFGRGYLCHSAPLKTGVSSIALAERISETDGRAKHAYKASERHLLDLIWPWIGSVAATFLRHLAARRARSGKEIAERLEERFGQTHLTRPSGDVLWLHAASVGEVRSILPLVPRFLDVWPDITILITTATVTGYETVSQSVKLMPQTLHARIIHQFAPYDVSRWVRSFLDHWRPIGLLLTDSELWPGWLRHCALRGIPVGLLNGRLSRLSFKRWRQIPFLSSPVFQRLAFVAARNEDDATQFRRLGAKGVFCAGDLKGLAPPPQIESEAVEALRASLGNRPVFVASSTHRGEELIIVEAVTSARRIVKDLIGIIIPRHPGRGEEIAQLGVRAFPRRSQDALPDKKDAIWVADTLGEVALFYQVADFIFIGHSLLPQGGGHNPYEAISAHALCATGPYRANFEDAYRQLGDRFTTINSAQSLTEWICHCAATPPSPKLTRLNQRDQPDHFSSISDTLISRIAAMTGL